MDSVKDYSRHSLIGILFFMTLLLLLVNAAFYYGIPSLFTKISISSSSQAGSQIQVAGVVEKLANLQNLLRVYFVPASAAIFLLSGLFLWLYLRESFIKFVNVSSETTGSKKADKETDMKLAAIEKKRKMQNDQKLFLHLLSVFQREGRLVDFFSENLEQYEDEQIGAAVRSIHENCKKTLDKYITLKAVVDQNEGDEITVEEGFDPATIKLTGNVTGHPPFKGVLRHRGWKAAKLELPALSQTSDPMNITPAEIEIK